METITGYSFRPEHLRVAERKPGISGFLRTRNGADFLEATIRSHIDAFDEIVAVYNQCTDATPDILARLAREYGPRLRVFHYADRVYPPGSGEHAAEPADSPHSLVNYYNFALSRTRFSHATKLDDDHLAIQPALSILLDSVRNGTSRGEMSCFSGLNLARDALGRIGVPASEPFSGGGDIGIFPVTPETFFVRDRRFERFRRGALRRRFSGFVYWHLKYLKGDLGFGNYELAGNPDSRYARRLEQLSRMPMMSLAQLKQRPLPLTDRLLGLVHAKRALIVARNRAVVTTFPQESFEAALDATSPGWREWLEREGGACASFR